VTAPGGGLCQIPERKGGDRRRRQKGKGGKEGATTDEEGGGNTTDGAATDGKDDAENKNGNQKGRPRNRNRGRKKGGEGKEGDDAEKKEGAVSGDEKKTGGGGRKPRKRFDDDITPEVKAKMQEKKLDMRQTSLLVAIDKCRVKFGPEGYAALAHADGIMAEGTFTCDGDGKVDLTWKNMLKFEGGEWKTADPISSASSGVLVSSFNWSDGKL
jgi:hypothetical protein